MPQASICHTALFLQGDRLERTHEATRGEKDPIPSREDDLMAWRRHMVLETTDGATLTQEGPSKCNSLP